jgi:glycosyltransferase involved in cell wall biosynthesis
LGADATTGWLVPPHDPDALGRALLEAAADPLLRAEMGVRAVARVQAQFSLDHSVAAYMAIYRELLP